MKNIDKKIINEFSGEKILITGGTGSVGLGLINQLIRCKPKGIRIFTNDENSVFEAKRIWGKQKNISFLIGDIRDSERLKFAIRDADIVFHAAAMKHVDLCEENPFDAIKTNIIGTSNILEASLLEDVKKFVFISTDKATNPSSTLGASKLLGEKLTLKASSYRGLGKTIFSVVRFGNVIGSRGSVFQIFHDQLKDGKPLTITDPKMTRFIMSINDAALLILKATQIAKDGETFILKMPSVRIDKLAQGIMDVFKQLFPKLNINEKMSIKGARPGERFHEFLITEDEIPYCFDVGNMYKIKKNKIGGKITKSNFSSETAPKIGKKDLIRIVKELFHEYYRIN